MLYIHQFPDWTHFTFDYEKILGALGKTRFMEGSLLRAINLCDIKDIENGLFSEDVIANNTIDAVITNLKNVKKETLIRKTNQSIDYKTLLDAVTNSNKPLTEKRLFNWYGSLSANKIQEFRKKESEISFKLNSLNFTFKGPNPERLQIEMENFLTWFDTSSIDGLIKAAIAHFWFITLRPFKESNGRMARIITMLQLARAKQSNKYAYAFIKQIELNKIDYFQILYKTQIGNGNLTEWILWFLSKIQNAIEESEKKISSKIQLNTFKLKNNSLITSNREKMLIDALFSNEFPDSFSVKNAAELFKTSHDTALRVIQELIKKKLLKATKKGGRGQTYSLLE